MFLIWLGASHQQHEVFQSKIYSSCFQPLSYRVILPSLPLDDSEIGRKVEKGMLFLGVVAGDESRSGMNEPKGTFTNRLLSTSHTE